jgi:hypothetical protein
VQSFSRNFQTDTLGLSSIRHILYDMHAFNNRQSIVHTPLSLEYATLWERCFVGTVAEKVRYTSGLVYNDFRLYVFFCKKTDQVYLYISTYMYGTYFVR